MRVILASASPRRRVLLTNIVPDFDVLPVPVDEDAVAAPYARAPRAAVRALARAKALAAAQPGALTLGADTVVALGRRMLGKPRDAAEARMMLHALSGRTHDVYTGVCLVNGSRVKTFSVRTRVTFRRLSDAEIDEYVACGEGLDKAGSYAVQGRAFAFLKSIRGDYFNVVGLPGAALARIFAAAHGIDAT